MFKTADPFNRTLRKIVREMRRPFRRHAPPRQFLGDEPPWIREIVGQVRPYTMTSNERIAALCNAVEYIVRTDIRGDIVECGVWRGGSMMAVAYALMHLGRTDRNLHLFDTYTGMTAPTKDDRRSFDGADAGKLLRTWSREGTMWAPSPLEEVTDNLGKTGYPTSRVHFVAGRIEDTVPSRAPAQLALLRLDTDFYESTRHELIHLYPRILPGGARSRAGEVDRDQGSQRDLLTPAWH